MHTSEYSIRGYEDPVRVFHNGDWSGEVIIAFREAPLNIHDKKKYPLQEVSIPGALLAAIALPATQEMMSDALVHFAERLPQTLGILKAMKESDEKGRRSKS